MATTLTARSVAAFKTVKVQEEIYDAVVPGLILRVGRGGTKTYIVRYRANGKHRRLTIARHPHLSLADARERARDEIAKTQGGEDPQQERLLTRSVDATFKALVDEVLEAKAETTREKTQRERRRIVETELLPHWGHLPAASITRRDVVQLVERIARRGSPVMANRTLALVKVLFNDGLKRGFPTLEAHPAARLDPPAAEAGRSRYLDRGEIKALWKAPPGKHR